MKYKTACWQLAAVGLQLAAYYKFRQKHQAASRKRPAASKQ